MAVALDVCDVFGLTVSRMKTEAMPAHPPTAQGGETVGCQGSGPLAHSNGKLDTTTEHAARVVETKRRMSVAWPCFGKFSEELRPIENRYSNSISGCIKGGGIDMLCYGYIACSLDAHHYNRLRTQHHRFPLPCNGAHREKDSHRVRWYEDTLTKVECKRLETTFRRRTLLFAACSLARGRQSVA